MAAKEDELATQREEKEKYKMELEQAKQAEARLKQELTALMASKEEQKKELDGARSESALMGEVSANIVNQLLRINNRVSKKKMMIL